MFDGGDLSAVVAAAGGGSATGGRVQNVNNGTHVYVHTHGRAVVPFLYHIFTFAYSRLYSGTVLYSFTTLASYGTLVKTFCESNTFNFLLRDREDDSCVHELPIQSWPHPAASNFLHNNTSSKSCTQQRQTTIFTVIPTTTSNRLVLLLLLPTPHTISAPISAHPSQPLRRRLYQISPGC